MGFLLHPQRGAAELGILVLPARQALLLGTKLAVTLLAVKAVLFHALRGALAVELHRPKRHLFLLLALRHRFLHLALELRALVKHPLHLEKRRHVNATHGADVAYR
ncbi:MAG: hypothetical protein IPP14_15810 [Planctomycetes bacterium]|nr:hypothetical protein [Planctomycetota bacterium]